jgi:nucleoside-diphosphate-sugar epimerase
VILVTGATGFVGREVVATLARKRFDVRGASRRNVRSVVEGVEYAVGCDLAPDGDWQTAVTGVDIVVHAAARVHVMRDSASDPLAAFRFANVAGTVNLARQAAAAGVRRFIFISSVKVNGEGTTPGHPYTADDAPSPLDAYGVSKHEAESALRRISDETGLEVVIIRPVLVYGPGVKANFHTMMRWIHMGIPLPFGATNNLRSLVALDNLVDLVVRSITHPKAANQTFMVSDGLDLSTGELLRRMSAALGKPARLFPIPPVMLNAVAGMLRKQNLAQRLCGSLQVDIRKTCELLEWAPPVSVEDAMARTARHYLQQIAG